MIPAHAGSSAPTMKVLRSRAEHSLQPERRQPRLDRRETLLHETAHAICHDRWGIDEGHSSRFWEIARELGVTRKAAPETDRLATIRARIARYVYRCIGCLGEWTRRTAFGRARLCASCEGKGRPSRLVLVRRPKRASRRKA